MQRLLFIVAMSVVLFSCGNSSNNNNGDWVTRAVFNGQNRIGSVAFTVGDTGYISTGFDGQYYYNDLWAYDPAGNAWSEKDTFPGPRRALGVAFATQNFGYVGGGWNASGLYGSVLYFNDFYQYSPATNAWTQIGSMPVPGNAGRKFAVAFGFGDPYDIGGVLGGTDGQYVYKDFYVWNEKSMSWSADNDYPGPKRQGAVSWTYNSAKTGYQAYVVTGTGDNNTNLTDFWRYSPAATAGSKWDNNLRRIAGVTDQSYDAGYRIVRTNAIAWQQDNNGVPKAYITFGSNGASQIDCWEYDLSGTDLWTQKNNFPPGGGRVGAVAMTIPYTDPKTQQRTSGSYVGLGGTSLASGLGGTYYSDWTQFFPNLPYNPDDYYAQ
ncbi:MAG TPA: kelch repeat-containing protein [Dinghuibacter sp.]|uniref:Kelch repeat-containing protein n=1 Tax=Dinghuibacter sp. TaxID=2024697 RepID=UPI002CFF08A5|nr:kelch repeat-containing protein [Dinghuibacter sp.]HTJ12908.1 kelch repeat-containing protein [Dinghuibacter sp.]